MKTSMKMPGIKEWTAIAILSAVAAVIIALCFHFPGFLFITLLVAASVLVFAGFLGTAWAIDVLKHYFKYGRFYK